MKSLLRAAAIAVASTALVAGGATVASAAPTATGQPAAVTTTTVSTAGVSTAVAPYPLEAQTKIRVKKIGKKLTFRFTARYSDDAGTPVGIRRVKLQVKKNHKWRTIHNAKLSSKGTGTYHRSDKKKRNYRMVIDATPLYQGVILTLPRKI